jgi:peptidoglycan-associated lipoprotein
MKIITSRFLLTLTLASTLSFIGCANKAKKHGASDGSNQYGNTGLGSSESLDSTPLPGRPEGVNPETDVDYQTLSADTVYFAFDSYTIGSAERPKLDRIAEYLRTNPSRSMMLAGHTDERGTLEYNRGLGERRAQAVRSYLIGLGIDGNRVNSISYGEERPAAAGSDESAYSQNRRVQPGLIKVP